MKPIEIKTPLTKDIIKKLKAGDEVTLSGVILTARDAAHKKLADMIKSGRRIPLNLKDACIYYAGPTPPTPPFDGLRAASRACRGTPRRPIGSCGPTTSSRMDPFAPILMKLGLGGMIGKGDRSPEVIKAMKKYGCVYFLATGGIGALLATKVKSARTILFSQLGPEAIHKLEVKDFPLMVGIDSKGRNIYDKTKWKKK